MVSRITDIHGRRPAALNPETDQECRQHSSRVSLAAPASQLDEFACQPVKCCLIHDGPVLCFDFCRIV